jgi:ammonia channel protein AmtB
MLGILGSGVPGLGAFAPEDTVAISLFGQIVGAIVMFLLGFVPGYVVSWIVDKAGMLRIPDAVQERGLDAVKVPAQAYPQGMASPESES